MFVRTCSGFGVGESGPESQWAAHVVSLSPQKRPRAEPAMLDCLIGFSLISVLGVEGHFDTLDLVAELDGRAKLQIHTLLHSGEGQQQ